MKQYSKEKQKQLVLTILVTAMVLCGLWFGLIRMQKQSLRNLAERRTAAARQLEKVKHAIANADQLEAEVAEAERQITKLEEGMASGDLYAWAINTVRQFKLPYKVEIPQFSQIDGPKDNSLLPNFPYQQATLTIGGTGHFHDFGRFLADFENAFPYARVLNLTLEPMSGLVNENRERLAFKMDIAMLVKPGA
jgi:Tfp pilus assembly protein PilO